MANQQLATTQQQLAMANEHIKSTSAQNEALFSEKNEL